MKNINKKGMGILMAVMMTMVLAIMASGFFIVTNYMTKTSQRELDKVKLYWAAESGSNFSVNWWKEQDDRTRIDWPYYYDPEAGSAFSSEDGDDSGMDDGNPKQPGPPPPPPDPDPEPDPDPDPTPGMMDDYDWDAGTQQESESSDLWMTTVPQELHDVNGYKADIVDKYAMGCIPEICNGIAVNNEFFLHSSSERIVLDYPNSSDSYTLYLLRYKGERIDEAEAAVWVMDTWAVDNESGNTYRVLMSNIMNFIPNTPPILQFNEGIVNSMWASGFNGRKGVYKDYDYRFGHSYFASQVRFDYKTQSNQGPTGPTFWGRIHSASEDPSMYGGSVGNPSIFKPGGYAYDRGLYAEGLFKTEAEAAEAVDASVLGGWEHVDPFDADDFAWSWSAVAATATNTPESAIYMLSSLNYPVGSDITIELRTETGASGEVITLAYVSAGGVLKERIQVGKGWVEAIAVPTEYDGVSIFGVSDDYFTLITEEDAVHVIDDLYLADMEELRLMYEQYSPEELADPTMEMLAKLYEAMYSIYPDSQISVFSGLALTEETIGDYFGNAGGRDNQLDFTQAPDGFMFCNVGFYLGEGDVAVSAGNTDFAFFNIGSLIIDSQGETSGSNSVDNPSSSVGFSFIQDKRFYDADFDAGIGWGPGPDQDGAPIQGLNKQYRWIGGYAGSGAVSEEDFNYIMR